ncbi:hypothetical protein CEUSTIGMA_g783.t1 [Chlamydomonas eustigma]|uniref:Uncharacterized protein n=1 Tax=Chlamydomonas eustigma TaxID=1157962 RepID=A0A250WRK4_9CHLO|nr:hypothetical protein CEUSTIGMA_g783.t1 [Chlamydomonas eustigma]|eukprot:GAX73329.1 hypothetical protein CEUSTIGMA_g783.t1 [Chlamydomonas eustigma]
MSDYGYTNINSLQKAEKKRRFITEANIRKQQAALLNEERSALSAYELEVRVAELLLVGSTEAFACLELPGRAARCEGAAAAEAGSLIGGVGEGIMASSPTIFLAIGSKVLATHFFRRLALHQGHELALVHSHAAPPTVPRRW